MSDDWDSSPEEQVKAKPVAPAQASKKPPVSKKWEGEDEDDDGPASDWDESSEEEEEEEDEKPSVAPPKKKGTLKQKLAEKEAAAKSNGNDDDDEDDSDAVLDPKEKARRDKERELKADLTNASDLLGAAALGGTSSSELDALISFQPRTKEDFAQFSSQVIEFLVKKHQSKPLYHTFVEHHARALALPLKDVEVRKVASGLTALSNEKQKEQREKAGGKKKSKAVTKPVGSAKVSSKLDTSVYDESLDDFGTNADDFM